MTIRHTRQNTPGLGFQLPPSITVTRQFLPDGLAYVFRDFELGELGRLAVEGTPTGETRITSEVAGFPNDPMMKRRLEVFEPLCKELTRKLESIRGEGRTAPLPFRTPQPMGQIPCEETRCETCGKMVAFLIFADGAIDDGLFEDSARLMYPHYARHNVPTYNFRVGCAMNSLRSTDLSFWASFDRLTKIHFYPTPYLQFGVQPF